MIPRLLPFGLLGALILMFTAPWGVMIFGLCLIACTLLASVEQIDE